MVLPAPPGASGGLCGLGCGQTPQRMGKAGPSAPVEGGGDGRGFLQEFQGAEKNLPEKH